MRVVHKDGREEVLSVVGPLEVRESGEGNGLSRFIDATGMEHWFHDEDGAYNGWGRAFPSGISTDEAINAIEAGESDREIGPKIEPPTCDDRVPPSLAIGELRTSSGRNPAANPFVENSRSKLS
jgi:hypothetical protein